MHPLLLHIAPYSYVGIFFALALGILGLPIPDEALMTFVGFMVFQGRLDYALAVIIAFVGTSFGMTMGYFIGRLSDHLLFKRYSGKLYIIQSVFKISNIFIFGMEKRYYS
jgi:membrane protein DedA with SNARE-associated domain